MKESKMKESKIKVSKMKVSEIDDERVRELLYELCAKTYIKGKSWKGYEVFEPYYSRPICIGLPYVVLKKGDEVRMLRTKSRLNILIFVLPMKRNKRVTKKEQT